jgi:hypothetical protein
VICYYSCLYQHLLEKGVITLWLLFKKDCLCLANIVATILHAIKCGPISKRGLGLIDPYVYTGASHIEAIIANKWLER